MPILLLYVKHIKQKKLYIVLYIEYKYEFNCKAMYKTMYNNKERRYVI